MLEFGLNVIPAYWHNTSPFLFASIYDLAKHSKTSFTLVSFFCAYSFKACFVEGLITICTRAVLLSLTFSVVLLS